VRNGETLNWAKIPEISTFYLAFNCESVDRPVRQAFAHAMNQHQIANGSSFYKGRTVPAYHLTPPLIYPGGASAYDEHASGGN
jgi:peptide/nickel transport system substrate-binding protein